VEIFFFRESSNTVDDQADIEESPSFEYNFDIEPKNEPRKLEMESDIETEIPKEIRDMVKRHENCFKPNIEEARTVDIGTVGIPREVKIGATLSTEQSQAITELLKEYHDIFAWSYRDMHRYCRTLPSPQARMQAS
jgi:hypothetical protein